MQIIKFKSKEPTCLLNDAKGSTISNPNIEPVEILKDVFWSNIINLLIYL